MRKIIATILIIICLGILLSLPLYLCGNFVLWCFQIPYHLTILQSLSLTLLASLIHHLLFKNKEGK